MYLQIDPIIPIFEIIEQHHTYKFSSHNWYHSYIFLMQYPPNILISKLNGFL